MMETKKNYLYVDLIKVVAIFLVVFLHTTGIHLSQWNKVGHDVWMIENTYESFTRMCVPLFIMISGAMLLKKEEAYSEFFRKRFMKILIPGIVWTIVYSEWRVHFLGENIGKKALLKMAISGPVYYHLWFFYMIVGLYIITPILRKFTRNASDKDLMYFSSLWVIFVSIIPTVLTWLHLKYGINIQLGIILPLITGHVGYYIIGYQLNRMEYKKLHIYLSWVVLIVSWLATNFGTLYVTSFVGNFHDIFYSYFSPTVVFEAISGFILLKHYGEILEDKISKGLKNVFSRLGVASFGVYLIHPLIRDVLLRYNLYFSVDTLKINPIISNPLAAIELTVISYIVVLILFKVPLLDFTVGGGRIPQKKSTIHANKNNR